LKVLLAARLELRLLARSGALAALGVTLLTLLVGATAAGLARHEQRRQQVERYRAIVDRQWAEQPDRHPHRVSHYGFLLFRDPPPLGFLDLGVAGFTGVSLFLEAHRQNLANFAEASVSPVAVRFGELTPASVLQLFLPLLVLLLGAAAITRDRENGTLPLALGLGTPFREIALGKWLALVALMAVALAPAMFGAAFLGARALLFLTITAAHLTAMAALGTAVSAWSRSTRGGLLAALGLWVGLFVLLPRALPVAATLLWPLPPRSVFEAEVERETRALGDSHNPNDPKFLAFRRELLAKHGVESLDELPQNYNGLLMAESERHTAQAYQTHVERLHALLDRHESLMSFGGLVSPYLALRALSMSIAGADVRHAREFERQAESYRFELIQRLNQLHAERLEYSRDRYLAGAEGAAPSRPRIDRAHFTALPRFASAPPSLGWALAGQWPGIAQNVGWLAASLGLLLVSTRGQPRAAR
jgi:ABC-2 type transport system permease protein